VEPSAEMDEAIKANYYLVFTDLYLRQGKYRDAAEKMELALKHIEKKKDRARPHFILAQIYHKLKESSNALREYEAVLKSHPDYELAFYAKINKAIAFSRRSGKSDEIKKELMDMLKDEKNKEYRDQIYYALGEIYQEEQNKTEAISCFEKSLAVTAPENKKQKSKTYLHLADLYFSDRYYSNAQQYYDSTLKTINDDHERYDEVKARAESLGELVGYINTIELNDSLVVICGLSASEQEKKLAEVVKVLEVKAQEQKAKDEAAAAAVVANAADPGITGTFWAYNANLKQKGFDAFKEYWGDRPLKDNWRLSSKLSQSYGTPDESIVVDTTATANKGGKNNVSEEEDDQYKVPDVQELKASLPCNDASKMASARYSVAEAYYKSGLIYKEKLDDERNAVSAWQDLTTNLDSSSFHPLAYYQLFRNYLNKEAARGGKKDGFCETCNSEYWANIIKQKYPGSEWARLVDNPEYLDQAEMKSKEENDAYEKAYRAYSNRMYFDAITAASNVISNEPNNSLLCRWRLLRAVCIGYTDASMGLKETYFKELNEVKTKCPGSSEAMRADELIRAGNQESVGGQVGAVKGSEEGDAGQGTEQNPKETATGGNTQNTTGTNGGNNSAPADSAAVAIDSPYKVDLAAEHYFAVLLPLQGTDVGKAKADVSDFNASFYTSLALKTTNNLLGQQYHIVLVKPFKTLPECKEYLSSFKANKDALGEINSGNPIMFVISKPNYIALFKTKDVQSYLDFYQANYQN
jgi:tetratricopeptide (TPR) repeat protein